MRAVLQRFTQVRREEAASVVASALTFFFLFVILGATDSRAPAGFAPIPIGLASTWNPDLIRDANRLAVGDIVPDLTVLLQLPTADGMRRAALRGRARAARGFDARGLRGR